MQFMKRKPISIHLGIFFCYSILLLLIVAAVCFSALYMTQKTVVTETGNSRIDVLSQINARVRLIKNSMTALSNLIYEDEKISAAVKRVDGSGTGPDGLLHNGINAYEIQENVKKYESAYQELDFGVYSVVSGEDGFDFCSDRNRSYAYERIRKCLWYKDVAAAQGNICWVSSYDDTFLEGAGNYVFSAARIFCDNDCGDRKGVLLICVPERILYDTYKIALNGNNSIYIVDKNGTIVSHDNPDRIGLNYFNMDVFGKLVDQNQFSIITKVDKKYLLSNVYDEGTGWTIVEEIPLDTLMTPMKELSGTIVCITAFCLILAFILAWVLSRLTVNPIRALCSCMARVKDGNLDICPLHTGWDETRLLGEAFNQMIGDMKTLMDQLKEKEKKKRMAELDFLQMQINPHFLYNTLFSIKCMMEMDRHADAIKMMDIFIPLLREGISSSQEMIYISDECRWIQRFVELIQFRYAEPIRMEFAVSEAAKRCYIPRMLLQPIVENCIYHGLESDREANILVEAFIRNSCVIVRVSDNGRGIDEGTIKKLSEDRWNKSSFNKVGLLNVRERIRIIFGEAYGLDVSSRQGEGTVVTMTMPVID